MMERMLNLQISSHFSGLQQNHVVCTRKMPPAWPAEFHVGCYTHGPNNTAHGRGDEIPLDRHAAEAVFARGLFRSRRASD